jgi:hypothetical protein
MSLKNSNDTIGNQTHHLPAGSAVPQPNAPPRTPLRIVVVLSRVIIQIILIKKPALKEAIKAQRGNKCIALLYL